VRTKHFKQAIQKGGCHSFIALIQGSLNLPQIALRTSLLSGSYRAR
jgi:hypothetical protein